MRISFRWNQSPDEIANRFAGEEAQLYLANEAKRLMDPYVPAMSTGGGSLSNHVRAYVENGKGVVHYLSPYARYQFEGKVMVSKRPGVRGAAKKVMQPEKALNYRNFPHPLATSHWDKAMSVARSGDLTRAVQNYIRGV